MLEAVTRTLNNNLMRAIKEAIPGITPSRIIECIVFYELKIIYKLNDTDLHDNTHYYSKVIQTYNNNKLHCRHSEALPIMTEVYFSLITQVVSNKMAVFAKLYTENVLPALRDARSYRAARDLIISARNVESETALFNKTVNPVTSSNLKSILCNKLINIIKRKFPYIDDSVLIQFIVFYELRKSLGIEDENWEEYNTIIERYQFYLPRLTPNKKEKITSKNHLEIEKKHQIIDRKIAWFMTLLEKSGPIQIQAINCENKASQLMSVKNITVSAAINVHNLFLFDYGINSFLENQVNNLSPSNVSTTLNTTTSSSSSDAQKNVLNTVMDLTDSKSATPDDAQPVVNLDFKLNLSEEGKAVERFHLDTPEQLQQLAERSNIEYLPHPDDKTNKLEIASVNLLSGGFGVYTRPGMTVKKGEILAVYTGDEIPVEIAFSDKYNDKSHYFMNLNSYGFVIDSKYKGNFSRFFNESNYSANAEFLLRMSGNKPEVIAVAINDIDCEKQILIDYGPEYVYDEGIKPVFLHPSDSPYNSVQLLKKHRADYSEAPYVFDYQDGSLDPLYMDKRECCMIPLPLADILAGNKEITSIQHPDLPLLFINEEDKTLYEYKDSERISSLMITSYLGSSVGVSALVKMKADPGMQMQIAGLSSFHLVMIGDDHLPTNEKSRREIIALFKELELNLLVLDEDGLTVFDWALKIKNSYCLDELLKGITPQTLLALLTKNNSAMQRVISLVEEEKWEHCDYLLTTMNSHPVQPYLKAFSRNINEFVNKDATYITTINILVDKMKERKSTSVSLVLKMLNVVEDAIKERKNKRRLGSDVSSNNTYSSLFKEPAKKITHKALKNTQESSGSVRCNP